MSETKTKKLKGMSPVGALSWPKFLEADKFNKLGTKVRFSAEAYAEFIAPLQPLIDASHERGAAEFDKLPKAARTKLKEVGLNTIGTPVYDDNEDETGEWDVNFSKKASGVNKKGEAWVSRPIPVFDAGGRPLKKADIEKVWSGSQAKVSFEYFPDGYWVPGTGACGLSIDIVAVQVIELAGPGQRAASSYGFGVEDGFAVSDESNDPDTDDDAAGDDAPAGASDF